MTDYVIRGGEDGKARLHVIGKALEPSTIALLDAAGLVEGMRCLDLGCGGGDVTLTMARIVGPAGRVVGIDMDPVKVDLARQDAARRALDNAELRTGDATALDADAEYDLVYARLLLTHLREPLTMVQRMARAVRPGGVVVVEDLDHSAVFAEPRSAALEEYVTIYNETARRRGGDPEIGPKLPGLLREAGLRYVQPTVLQPAFTEGEAKRIHEITLENVIDPVVADGLASVGHLRSLAAQLRAIADDPKTIVSFPRIHQVFGRRPTTLAGLDETSVAG